MLKTALLERIGLQSRSLCYCHRPETVGLLFRLLCQELKELNKQRYLELM